jgi:ketosteroid isomerase-like protein
MTQHTTTTLTDPKVETIQRLYAAFGAHDMDTIMNAITDDVDWASESITTSAPWYGTYNGKSEVPRFFQALGSSVQVSEFTPLSVTSNDTDVMVVIRWTITANSTGRSATMNLHHWWRFADDGKIAFYRGQDDSERTAELFA